MFIKWPFGPQLLRQLLNKLYIYHVLFAHVVHVSFVDCADIFDLLQVAGVGPCPQDETDATPWVSPSTRHQTS